MRSERTLNFGTDAYLMTRSALSSHMCVGPKSEPWNDFLAKDLKFDQINIEVSHVEMDQNNFLTINDVNRILFFILLTY